MNGPARFVICLFVVYFLVVKNQTSLATWLVLAFFIVKGFLSWLADVAIWALRLLDPVDNEEGDSKPRKLLENQLCERCANIVEEALDAERNKTTKLTEQNQRGGS